MHLCFYLITACFLVLPRMCETTKTILEYIGLPFMVVNQPMMLVAELPFLGLVKTCKDEEVVKRLKIWFQRIHFVLQRCLLISSSSQAQTVDTGLEMRSWTAPLWLCPRVCLVITAVLVLLGLHHCRLI